MHDDGREPQAGNGSGQEAPQDGAPEADAVEAIVERVRQDLAARRAAGELPHLPADELDRQFGAVVDAVVAGLVEEPPLDTARLSGLAVLETWQPRTGGLRGRAIRMVVHVPSRLVGALVRRQVDGFSRTVTELIDDLGSRQGRITAFLARAHLERLRGLEYRVAELEREVTALRSDPAGAPLGTASGQDAGGDAR